MCYHGHQLPELFLLDEQKCATTSLSTDLHDKWGVIHGAEKEPHYFDHNGHDLSTFAKLFPPCGPHVVTFDGTPKYVLDGVNARSHHSLQFLKSTYGVARLKKTTFAMILCDPAQRAQSFTYHLGMYDRRWGSIGDTDFKAKASHPDLSYFFAFRNGLYAEIIDHVLQELGQLTIIPAPIYYTHPELAIKELIEVIRERSGKTPPSTSHGHDIAHHVNIHPHPPIMEDTRPQDRPRIREYYANTVDNLGGGFAMNPKRYFEEMQCSDEMNIEKFWNGDPSSSVAAGEGLPTSSVAAGEGGGEGGRLSSGKDPAWVPVVDCKDWD